MGSNSNEFSVGLGNPIHSGEIRDFIDNNLTGVDKSGSTGKRWGLTKRRKFELAINQYLFKNPRQSQAENNIYSEKLLKTFDRLNNTPSASVGEFNEAIRSAEDASPSPRAPLAIMPPGAIPPADPATPDPLTSSQGMPGSLANRGAGQADVEAGTELAKRARLDLPEDAAMEEEEAEEEEVAGDVDLAGGSDPHTVINIGQVGGPGEARAPPQIEGPGASGPPEGCGVPAVLATQYPGLTVMEIFQQLQKDGFEEANILRGKVQQQQSQIDNFQTTNIEAMKEVRAAEKKAAVCKEDLETSKDLEDQAKREAREAAAAREEMSNQLYDQLRKKEASDKVNRELCETRVLDVKNRVDKEVEEKSKAKNDALTSKLDEIKRSEEDERLREPLLNKIAELEKTIGIETPASKERDELRKLLNQRMVEQKPDSKEDIVGMVRQIMADQGKSDIRAKLGLQDVSKKSKKGKKEEKKNVEQLAQILENIFNPSKVHKKKSKKPRSKILQTPK